MLIEWKGGSSLVLCFIGYILTYNNADNRKSYLLLTFLPAVIRLLYYKTLFLIQGALIQCQHFFLGKSLFRWLMFRNLQWNQMRMLFWKLNPAIFCLVTQPVPSPVCPLIGNSVQNRVLFQGKHDETGKQEENPPKVLPDAKILFGMMWVKDFWIFSVNFGFIAQQERSNKISHLLQFKTNCEV